MKKWVLLGMILSTGILSAQSNQDYMNLIKQNLDLELKSFIYEGLELTPLEEDAFSPVFDQFLEDSGKITVEKANLFDSYANNLSTLSSNEIDQLNKEVLKTDLEKIKTNKKYYKKFVKAIGVEKTTSLFFLKRYLDNAIEGAKLDFLAE